MCSARSTWWSANAQLAGIVCSRLLAATTAAAVVDPTCVPPVAGRQLHRFEGAYDQCRDVAGVDSHVVKSARKCNSTLDRASTKQPTLKYFPPTRPPAHTQTHTTPTPPIPTPPPHLYPHRGREQHPNSRTHPEVSKTAAKLCNPP